GPSETQRPRLVTQRTIAGALVIHTGTFPPNGKFVGIPPSPTPIPQEQSSDQNATKGPPPPTPTPPFPDVITLGVPLQDAVTLTWFVEAKVPITLALRSTKDNGSVLPSTGVTLRYLIDTFGIAAPPKLPYSLEPALRSIRQVVTGAELQFNTSGA